MAKLSIVGSKNSGKTTLIEQLIPHLTSNGMIVSSVKHTSHNHSFDTPGKDSHRHQKAGSYQTLVVSSTELALFGQADLDLQRTLENLIEQRCDLVLIEGDKFSDIPKLLLTHNIDQLVVNDITNVIATYGEQNINLPVPHLSLDNLDQVVQFVTTFLTQNETNCKSHA